MRDLVDVALVAFLLYRFLILIRGTRALQMLTGLAILGISYLFSSAFDLYTAHWIFSHFFEYLFIVVIVVFQDDIKLALAHVGKTPFFGTMTSDLEREMIDDIARAASQMASENIGALIVVEREMPLKNFVDTGARLDAKPSSELIYSLFLPDSPIHDGAVVLSRSRIAAAGCFLPLSKDPTLDPRLGTRHRAALGLTEQTDAVVVLVSEEAGEAYVVYSGRISPGLSEQEIRFALQKTQGLDHFTHQQRTWKKWLRRHS